MTPDNTPTSPLSDLQKQGHTPASLTCDVCSRPAAGVASSSFGAVSWAFCTECAHKPAEPSVTFAYLYDEVSDQGEGLADHVQQFFTWKDGAYQSWPDYVANRRNQEDRPND